MENSQHVSNGAPQAEPKTSAHADKPKRVLLIEGEPSTRLVLLQKFRTAGFDVDLAPNGHVALDKLRASSPDAIFMDLLLPDSNGAEVIKAARGHQGFGQRPIYVCTSASFMSAWTRKGKKAGASKVFDRASIPIDAIIAEIAKELIGSKATDAPRKEPEPTQEVPPQKPDGEPETRPAVHPVAHSDSNPAPAGKANVQPSSIFQRVIKSLGLATRAETATTPSEPSASPAAIPTVEAPTPSDFAAGHGAENQPLPTPLPPPQPASDSLAQPPESGSQLDGIDMTHFGECPVPPAGNGVAVLTLNEAATIVAANECCAVLFGWDRASLVGKNLRILLTGDVEHELQRLVRQQQQAAAEQSKAPCSLDVRARREDGTEFQATVTIMTWCSDTTLTRKSEVAQFTWTALFRQAGADANSHGQDATAQEPANPVAFPSLVFPGSVFSGAPGTLPAENELSTTALRKDAERAGPHLHRVPEQEKPLREQLDAAKAEAEKAEAACRQEIARAAVFRGELAEMQAGYDVLNGKLTAEKVVVEEATRRAQELEGRLRESTTECATIKAELEKQNEERGRLESEWREQLTQADALIEELKSSWKDESNRNAAFEERLRTLGESLKQEQIQRNRRMDEEVEGLRRERDDLENKLQGEHEAAAESGQRAENLASRLRDSAAEVESARAKLEEQTAEHARLESEWRKKLSTSETLTNELEAAWVEAEQRSNRFEEELAGLRQTRDELIERLAAEQRTVAESMKRNDELAIRVIENATELERVRTELEKAGRNEHFEDRLANLQQIHNNLTDELRTEQQTTEKSKHHSEELENRLRANSTELEKVKADADKHAEEQARLESELKAQLETAKAATEQAEQALKAKVAQCGQFENELAGLRRGRDEVERNLAAEQQAAAESKRRNEELEGRLRENSVELDRVRAGAERQAEEQTRLEAELRAQLSAAKAATAQAESATRAEAARSQNFEEWAQNFRLSQKQEQIESAQRFERDLAQLRENRDELLARLTAEQQTAAESRARSQTVEQQLQETLARLERVQAELASRGEEQARLEGEWRGQLDAARTAKEQAEAARAQEAERFTRAEAELARLCQERHELHEKFTAEQQVAADLRRRGDEFENRLRESATALEAIQTERIQQTEGHQRLQAEWSEQLANAQSATARAEEAIKDGEARYRLLAQDIQNLRDERHQIYDRFRQEHQAGAKSIRRIKELETRLRETTGSLKHATAEMKKAAEQLRAETDKRKRSERAHARAEHKLAGLQEAQAEGSRQLAEAQQAAEAAKQRGEELEKRQQESAAELERVRTELAQHASERHRLEAELQPLAETKDSLAKALGALRESEAIRWAEVAEWEGRLREGAASQARVTSDLEMERAERHRLEERAASLASQLHELHEELKQHVALEEAGEQRVAELVQQLQGRDEAMAKASLDLQRETAGRHSAEQQLRDMTAMSDELQRHLSLLEEAKKVFARRESELELQLQARVETLQASESSLHQETSERRRLEAALEAAQHELQRQGERTALERARLEAAAQVEQLERKRLEAESVQLRYASVDSARVGRAMLNSFRHRMHDSVDHLVDASRRLLQAGSAEEQKKLVESLLENALLLQTSLHEGRTTETGAARNASELPASSDGVRPPGLLSDKPAELLP